MIRNEGDSLPFDELLDLRQGRFIRGFVRQRPPSIAASRDKVAYSNSPMARIVQRRFLVGFAAKAQYPLCGDGQIDRESLFVCGGMETLLKVDYSPRFGSFDHEILAVAAKTLLCQGRRSFKSCRKRISAETISHANKNSFVLNSLILSLNFAAFSNSNRFAVSRISVSIFAI